MIRYVQAIDGVVRNVTQAAPGFQMPAGWIQSDTANIHDLWDGQVYTPAPLPGPLVPESITRAQGKAALIEFGMWAGVLTYVAGIEDDTQRALAEVALNDTQYWSRTSPFLNAAADGLGLTPAQLDALFVRAAEILL